MSTNESTEQKIDEILLKIQNYYVCEEWHIHDDSSLYKEHMQFDEDKARQAILSLIAEEKDKS